MIKSPNLYDHRTKEIIAVVLHLQMKDLATDSEAHLCSVYTDQLSLDCSCSNSEMEMQTRVTEDENPIQPQPCNETVTVSQFEEVGWMSHRALLFFDPYVPGRGKH